MTQHIAAGQPGSTEPMHGLGDLALALGGSEDSFTGELLKLIAKAEATPENYFGLKRGFPRIVTAWELWMNASPPPTGDELLATLQEVYTCPKCLMTSWNPHDAANGYCGNCHEFTATA